MDTADTSLDPMTHCEPSIIFLNFFRSGGGGGGGGSKLFSMAEIGSHIGVS